MGDATFDADLDLFLKAWLGDVPTDVDRMTSIRRVIDVAVNQALATRQTSHGDAEDGHGSEAGTGAATPTTTAPVPLPPCRICRGHEANRLVPHEHDCPAPGRRALVELIDSEDLAAAAIRDPRRTGPIAADTLADPENAPIVDAFINEIRRNR